MERPEYLVSLTFNNKHISRVVIDQHYKVAHPELSDELIINLVKTLDELRLDPEEIDDGFEYYKVDPAYYLDKPYRLVFLIFIDEDFIGVITAFRVRRTSHD